jgi:SAM-dependent methyltransferase
MLLRQQDIYARAKYEILLDWLDGTQSAPLEILNVGSGSGEMCFLLADRGHRVRGVDPVERYVLMARAQAQAEGRSRCSFDVADLRAVAQASPPIQYDLVLSTDVLEHIDDDVEAMQQLASLVRPGGSLFVVVPAGQYLFGNHDRELGHFRRYSLRTLAALLPEGMLVRRLRYFGISLIPVAWLYSRMLQRYYPVAATGGQARNAVLARAAQWILRAEQRIAPPLGSACLLWAVKTSA